MTEIVVRRENASLEAGREGAYVDWGCAFAGAMTAAALSFVLITFGSGIGLSLLSPRAVGGSSLMVFALVTSFWAVLVQVSAFAAGGYLAGRMRKPWKDATPHEVEFRDGAHGALVWAVGVGFGAALLAFSGAGLARTGATSGASSLPNDPINYAVDALFRSNPPALPLQDARSFDPRAEAARILLAELSGTGSPADRAYLSQLVATRTGLVATEAQARVAEVIATTAASADRARKVGIVAAFLAAASLLAGCATAWTAARLGGTHRDQGIIWRGFSRAGSWSFEQSRTGI